MVTPAGPDTLKTGATFVPLTVLVTSNVVSSLIVYAAGWELRTNAGDVALGKPAPKAPVRPLPLRSATVRLPGLELKLYRTKVFVSVIKSPCGGLKRLPL